MEEIDYKTRIIKILYENNPLRLSQLEEKFLLSLDSNINKYDFPKFLLAIWALEDEEILKRDEKSKKFYLTQKGKEETL
ncbi:MAG: hypothetical protein QXU74_02605 [Candidatus Aenigmatarchaeota archaeon]